MRYQRAVLPVVLLLASACVRTPPTTSLAPDLGPTGSIRALYDGGLLHRRVSAHFTVDQGSYAMVAHLGGDGVIRIVYPQRAANAWVRPGELYRTTAFSGDYDAAPSYYFQAVTRIRSQGARNWSYDGRGHGFVFMILSRRAFRLNELSDFGMWNEFEVVDYRMMNDPRVSIRKFADAVTGGTDYTIEYAHSFSTYAYTSYADHMWDCSMLYFGFGGPWSYLDRWVYGNRYGPQCGNYFGYAYWSPYGYPYGGYPRAPGTPTVNPPPTPTPTPVAQRQPRPTFVPTIPSDRRTPERRATTATAYKPTWADNPTFAPEPRERTTTSSRRPTYYPGTTSTADRRADDSRRGTSSSGSSSSGTSSSGGTSQPAAAPAPAPAPAPTMSPGHAGGSGSGRRPPA